MRNYLSLMSVGHASSLFMVITFSICAVFDLLFPDYAMIRIWQGLLPGFSLTEWWGFIIGLIESYAYGWYFALIWVPIYNYFNSRNKENGSCCH